MAYNPDGDDKYTGKKKKGCNPKNKRCPGTGGNKPVYNADTMSNNAGSPANPPAGLGSL